jgi:hypothetical protein
VLNGYEIGGGSVRIHRNEMQSTVFELLGIVARKRSASSAFCSRRCSTARRRTAASRSASTARDADGRAEIDPRRDRVPEDADATDRYD